MKLLIFLFLLFVSVSAYNCSVPIIDCSGRGQCIPITKTCLCDDGYITWPSDNTYECNYKQTKKLGPFLCQIFIGWFSGCGAFMLGQYDYAITELLLFILFLVSLCIHVCLHDLIQGNKLNIKIAACGIIGNSLALLLPLIIFALWIAVIVFGGFNDKNGAPLGDF